VILVVIFVVISLKGATGMGRRSSWNGGSFGGSGRRGGSGIGDVVLPMIIGGIIGSMGSGGSGSGGGDSGGGGGDGGWGGFGGGGDFGGGGAGGDCDTMIQEQLKDLMICRSDAR
jgi:hypothetical protein